mgnify:CR=1 FL=1
MILFGAYQFSIWCAPIDWLVLTDFKLVLTNSPAGRNRFFQSFFINSQRKYSK